LGGCTGSGQAAPVAQRQPTPHMLPPSGAYNNTGWPNKNRTFWRYHIFAATTNIIMRFLLKCSKITAEDNKRHFLKRVLNILCKVTGNGLHHTRLLDDDQPGLG